MGSSVCDRTMINITISTAITDVGYANRDIVGETSLSLCTKTCFLALTGSKIVLSRYVPVVLRRLNFRSTTATICTV